MNLEENGSYQGPDGTSYPKFNQWMVDTCNAVAKGDLSTFFARLDGQPDPHWIPERHRL